MAAPMPSAGRSWWLLDERDADPADEPDPGRRVDGAGDRGRHERPPRPAPQYLAEAEQPIRERQLPRVEVALERVRGRLGDAVANRRDGEERGDRPARDEQSIRDADQAGVEQRQRQQVEPEEPRLEAGRYHAGGAGQQLVEHEQPRLPVQERAVPRKQRLSSCRRIDGT